jgi:ABC-type glycerol-3-phosphate transport system permease component
MLDTNRLKRSTSAVLIILILTVVAVVGLGPIYYLIITSLKSRSEYLFNIFGLPQKITLENFRRVVFEYNFPRMFMNSLLLTLCSVLIGTYLAALSAYAFGKMQFLGKNAFFNLIIPLMSIPPIVMVIPLFVLMTKMKMVNNFPAPILIYVGLIIPFSIYLITSFMNSIPDTIIEAARIDGCSNMGIFHRIVLPLSVPALTTVIIVNGMWIWNELLIAFIFLQSEEKRTLMVGLTSLQGLFNVDIPLMMAGATIVTIPLLIIYIVSQRWFIRGLVQGAIK